MLFGFLFTLWLINFLFETDNARVSVEQLSTARVDVDSADVRYRIVPYCTVLYCTAKSVSFWRRGSRANGLFVLIIALDLLALHDTSCFLLWLYLVFAIHHYLAPTWTTAFWFHFYLYHIISLNICRATEAL